MTRFWKVLLIILGSLFVIGAGALALILSGFRFLRLSLLAQAAARPEMMHALPRAGFDLPFVGMLIPALLISLLILLGIWIGKSSHPTIIQNVIAAAPASTPDPDPVCSGCGRDLYPQWIACPYCGEKR